MFSKEKEISFHSIAYFAQNEGSGHFYHYHRAVQKAMEQYGIGVTVYVPLTAHFEKMPDGWKKWFSSFHNRRGRKNFWKECKRLFQQKVAGRRIFFIEFFGRKDFFLYALAALFYAHKNVALWVLYRDDLTIRRRKDLHTIRCLSKLLRWRFRDRFRSLTDSELLADYYQGWFNQRPHVVPVLYGPVGQISLKKSENLICCWMGSPRSEKGASEIARLVQITDPSSKNIELDVSGAAYIPTVKNQLKMTLRKAFLNEEEYYDALKRCDVLLLPYDPQKYQRRTSGIFVEAILAGKIPFVKEGSWLAHELHRFQLNELIVDWHHPQFFTHILSLVQNASIIEKLTKMQSAYLDFHGEKNFACSLSTQLTASPQVKTR